MIWPEVKLKAQPVGHSWAAEPQRRRIELMALDGVRGHAGTSLRNYSFTCRGGG